jgi:hypothetical protein
MNLAADMRPRKEAAFPRPTHFPWAPLRRWGVVVIACWLAGTTGVASSAPKGRPPSKGRPPASGKAAGVKRAASRKDMNGGPGWFAPDSFWNVPLLADAPLDPNSDALVQTLVGLVHADQSANRGPWINTSQYSVPVYTVGKDQPPMRVTLNHGDSVLQRAFERVPVPPDAAPAAGTDGHLAVWQPVTDTLWEFWQARHTANGWAASWGGRMTRVSRSPGYYRDLTDAAGGVQERASWGSTACSLPIVGGLMTIQELQAGHIHHALQFMLPRPRAGVFSWPAQRTDGTDAGPNAIPEGARFRLDPRLNLDSLTLPPMTRMMAEAAQKYGLVVNDATNSVVGFRAEDPTPLVRTGRPDPYPALFQHQFPTQFLAAFPWDRLQLLPLRLSKNGQTHP